MNQFVQFMEIVARSQCSGVKLLRVDLRHLARVVRQEARLLHRLRRHRAEVVLRDTHLVPPAGAVAVAALGVERISGARRWAPSASVRGGRGREGLRACESLVSMPSSSAKSAKPPARRSEALRPSGWAATSGKASPMISL